ncbi:MAG: hypothetical protein IKY21_03560 [Clostridia bacterium]|nr:hypothetical protein [Clostridia bacterium]
MKKIILVLLAVILASCTFAFSVSAESTNISDVAYEIGQLEKFDNFCITSIILVPDETNAMVINGKTVVDGKDVEWTEKYDLTTEQYLALFKVNNSNLVYDAATAQALPQSVIDIIVSAIQPATLDVELEYNGFGNDGFLRNIKYMGLGMLGIFVVIGIVMLITYILNSVTGKKKA